MKTKHPFLADFHIHSRFSDGQMTIADIVDRYGSLGFGAIAITDHVAEEESLIGQASMFLNLFSRVRHFLGINARSRSKRLEPGTSTRWSCYLDSS